MSRRVTFCGIGLLLLFNVSVAQVPDLKFVDPLRFFDLSDNNVNCIIQDTVGFMWIGTNSGLNRFDGYELRVYKYIVGDNNSLINNQITKLFLDSKSRLWIGTKHGLCCYVPEYDNFSWLSHESVPSGLNNYEITDIKEGKDGKVYISNTSGIYRYDEPLQKFSLVYAIPKGDLSCFLFDNDNQIWIAAYKEGGLIRYNQETGQAEYFVHDKNKNSISSNSPVCLALQGKRLWIATYDGGVNCYDIDLNHFKVFPVNGEYELQCRSVYIDRDNYVWVVDVTGLKVYDARNDNFYDYYVDPSDNMSIKRSCNGIYKDNEGNYWTTHAGEGIGLSAVQKGFITFTNNPADTWHVSSEFISAINEDGDGNLWLGNPHNGIDVFQWTKSRVKTYLNNQNDKSSLGKGAVFSIFRDSENKMWVGTNMGGLQCYDPTTDRFLSWMNNPLDTNSIANNDVRSIVEDNEGNLWVVVHGKGIDKFDRKQNIFYHYNSKNNNLSNDYCFSLLADSKGDIWAATVWGLSVLRKDDKAFKNYYQVEKDTNSLTDNNIVSLYEDDNHIIWVGTSNGLNSYNRQADNFTRYGNGFAGTVINAILSDSKGMIWVGTSKGITRLDPVTGLYRNFDRRDGIISYGIYPRSCFRNSQKDLFFGGDRGVNIVPPEKLRFNTKPPKVIISGFKIVNKDYTDFTHDGVPNKSIIYTKSVKLDYNLNVISISFTAFDFLAPLKNSYSYKLEGFDKDWTSPENKREVTYTNLDPKKYVFRVRAANSDGYWNNTGAALEIIVLPPWYKTLLFKILLILLLGGFVVSITFFRTNQLQKQKLMLEKQVRERTVELSGKNELLQKQANELNHANQELLQANRTKDKLFSVIAHDIINPFNTLLGFTDVLREDFDRIGDNEKKDIINMIGTSSDRIHELLENLLKWTKTQTGKITVNKRVFRIAPVVRSAVTIFEHTAINKKIIINTDLPEDQMAFADEDMVSTILRNLLNNAIKFTPEEGKINITAEEDDENVTIHVSDTGIGINEKVAVTLFDSNNRDVALGTRGEKGSGLGLVICKEFADINGGRMSVKSEPGKGSTFSLTLPTG